ncbi:MAG: tRNA (guanosine(46)-N7)-methyltransferase TrmB [Oscillospiraceae bacterium]|nr:tRNA (guanosine(46)-N7)-methyltransferase TrmB [Oscillospiraceae bacterium]
MRKKPWAEGELAYTSFFVKDPLFYTEDPGTLFKNRQPIAVELGCGKGVFLSKYALLHPEINFIAIDIKKDILAVTSRNLKNAYAAFEVSIDNLVLIHRNVEHIDRLFTGPAFADAVFINFPNPWPKARHQKRQLTHPRQLLLYRDILKDDAVLHFKTDDEPLFLSTSRNLAECGYTAVFTTKDYHSDVAAEFRYPPSEHETQFQSEGKPIYCIEAKKQ